MKHLYLLPFLFMSFTAFGQFNFYGGYSLSVPGKEMAKNIQPLHSITGGLLYKLACDRFQVGVDLGLGTYANTRKEQTFNFGNGTSTRTFVNYSSNVFQGAFTGRFLLVKNALFTPYVSGKAGYASFYSNIFIEDPDDPGGCKALDQSNLIKDGTFTAGYGGGLTVDLSLFCESLPKGSRLIDFGVSKNSGGRVEYINTKRLIHANNPPTGTDGKPLNVKFINATTNQIHEHQVAEVYNSPVRMLEFKVSATFSLGRCR